jgi:hypothetical protein
MRRGDAATARPLLAGGRSANDTGRLVLACTGGQADAILAPSAPAPNS